MVTSKSLAISSIIVNIFFVLCFLWYWRYVRADTIFTPNYSERSFDDIECGMEMRDVLAKVGIPFAIEFFDGSNKLIVNIEGSMIDANNIGELIHTHHPELIFFTYSRPGSEMLNYEIRLVEFYNNQRVKKVSKSLYVD